MIHCNHDIGYKANRNIRLLTVNKNAWSNATRVIIKNDAGTILTIFYW